MPGTLPARRSRRAARDPAASRRSTGRDVDCLVAMTVRDGSEPVRWRWRRRFLMALNTSSTPFTRAQHRAKLAVMSGDAQLMLMIAGMHLLGLVCAAVLIIPALREDPEFPPRHSDPGSDGGGGSGPGRPPLRPDRPRGGIPLPDAEQARVRLRDHRKLSEQLPRPERRPAREPVRTPVRVRTH